MVVVFFAISASYFLRDGTPAQSSLRLAFVSTIRIVCRATRESNRFRGVISKKGLLRPNAPKCELEEGENQRQGRGDVMGHSKVGDGSALPASLPDTLKRAVSMHLASVLVRSRPTSFSADQSHLRFSPWQFRSSLQIPF